MISIQGIPIVAARIAAELKSKKAIATLQRDRSRINLSEDYEVRYWTEALGISREGLEDLVRQHGNSAEKIREVLNLGQGGPRLAIRKKAA